MEYAECEAVVKDFPPFREAMKKRGIEDMDLVMVDPWLVILSDSFLCISWEKKLNTCGELHSHLTYVLLLQVCWISQ